MTRPNARIAVIAIGLVGASAILGGCGGRPASGDVATLPGADDGRDWPGYGRTGGQEHFSPLAEVDQTSVAKLGLAWSMDLPAANSVTQPIAIGGVLYFASGLSVVHAVDAATGKELWTYDPEVGAVGGLNLRMAWGVRGVAWWNGKVYVGTQDGRLIAIDAKSGKPVWTVQTTDPAEAVHVNGAPRVFDGRVLIGAASSTGSARGRVSAYDAETGKMLWRFWTVPGNPAKPFENGAMAMAAKTWAGQWWKYGGGGMVWNSMAYDAALGTVYIGTGSPYPWNRRIRSDDKGDNLFVDSIVALDAKTGAYKWHYQTTPGDSWDFDATMDIELADITLGGVRRKVLMQAPKNGFFYVIDRVTGKLISARPYVDVSWASGVDMRSGRPVETPGARYTNGKPALVTPTSLGAHSWMSMAFSPQTGLAYIPANHSVARYSDIDRKWAPPADRSVDGGNMVAAGPAAGMKPTTGSLVAWSPVSQKAVWRVPYPSHLNGGILATGGNLVFQGSIDGRFRAYAADTGKVAWTFDAKAPIIATPISYSVNGRQYVTVLTGSGMGVSMYAATMFGEGIQRFDIDPLTQARRVLTFAMGGGQKLPEAQTPPRPDADIGFHPDPAAVDRGYVTYSVHCSTCHGDRAIGIGNGPDLRRSAIPRDKQAFAQIVRGGALQAQGMPAFGELSDGQLDDVRAYLRYRAAQLRGDIAPDARPTPSHGPGV